MRNISVLSSILFLLGVCAHAGKVKRQVSFDFGFGNNNQQPNIGQFLGGLFGQGGNKTKNPVGGLFDVLSGVATQLGITPNPNNNNSPNNQNQFGPFTFGVQTLESQGCSNNNGGCQHVCRMIHGTRKQCSCNEGYHLHREDGSCHDNNECAEFRPCQERCENTQGSYRCFCSRGTVQPDGSCRSGGFSIGGGGNHGGGTSGGLVQRSCRIQNGGCEQICTQFRDGVQCGCQPGFTSGQNPGSCLDVDECAQGRHNCHNRCINTVGSYTCHGVSFPSGPTSAPTPTCANNNGGCQQRCKDTRRGIKCKCSNGMVIQSDGKSCGCPSGAVQVGNICLGGSSGSSSNNEKIDCNSNNGGCAQRCVIKRSGRRGRRRKGECSCTRDHYVLHSDKRACICENGFFENAAKNKCLTAAELERDVGDCKDNNGGCHHSCVVTAIGFHCKCHPTARLQPDAKSCKCLPGLVHSEHEKKCVEIEANQPIEINPCTVNNGGCQHKCTYSGSSTLTLRTLPKCSCNALYDLAPDGRSCIAQNPCNTNNGGCQHICNNNNGRASCSCQSGWQLGSDGKFCIEIPKPITPKPTTAAPPRQGCGVNNKKDLLRRIVGGKPADPKDWPWMAAILRKRNSDQFCGGVLITDRHILTASHCLVDFKKEDILVRLGEYDFSSKADNSPTDFSVVDIRLHENYNRSSQENDIAIMKLDRPSTFSEYIWPVCLPPANQNFKNQLGYVTGWGTTSFGGEVSRVLQEVVVPVWDQSDCSNAYPSKVVSSMMCAGLKQGGKDSCQGDSGGPFLAQIYPSSRWFAIGVVSWGIKCAAAENPGVYTRVNQYLPWIKENAQF